MYEQFCAAICAQVDKTKACKGHEAFKADVDKLKCINTGYGLPAITANAWLEKICELTDQQLLDYVERYTAELLDAETAHYAFVGKNENGR